MSIAPTRLLKRYLSTNSVFCNYRLAYQIAKPKLINKIKGYYESQENGVLLTHKTLDFLQNNKVVLSPKAGLKSININDQYEMRGTDGASVFLYQTVPLIKYHNPHIPIKCTKDPSKPWNIEINYENDEKKILEVKDLSSTEILQLVTDAVS